MKRVDIVDVKADIRDGELAVTINEYGNVLLHDVQSRESVKIGDVDLSWVKG